MKMITQIYLIRAQSEINQSNDCNQLQLVFVTDPLQQKQLDDRDVSNSYLSSRSY